jgi:hypothetical protein
MSESVPKLLELKFLKKLSKAIVLPMLIASFIAQTGVSFSLFGLDVQVQISASFWMQAWQLLLILVLNSIFVGVPCWLAHNLLPLLYSLTFMNWFQRSLLPVVALLPITFGFLGIFGGDLPVLSLIKPFWFYTAFILGFYLLEVEDEMDRSGRGTNDDGDLSYPRRTFPLAFNRDIF